MITIKSIPYDVKDVLLSNIKLLLDEFVTNSARPFLPQFTGTSFEKQTKKRSWKKPKDKPRRPLSAYNLFFQSERKKLIAMLPDIANIKEYGFTEEERKAKHRKMHGKIGFAELARNIADKWNNLDDTEKATFEATARIEKEKYQEALDKWKATHSHERKIRKRSRRKQGIKTSNQGFSVNFSLENTLKSPNPSQDSSVSFVNAETYQSLIHGFEPERQPEAFGTQDDSKIDDMISYIANCDQDLINEYQHDCVKSFEFEYDQECQNHLHNLQIKGEISDSLKTSWNECSSIDGTVLDEFMDNSYHDTDYEDDFSI
jgi:hypothetical protein